MINYVHVAVGVIGDADGRVLIARRPPGVHQGGMWEFPGGKLEAGESVLTALQRELREELGIRIQKSACVPLKKIRHHYGDKAVLLDTWRVDSFQGDPRGLEDQPVVWAPVQQLSADSFPAANREIVKLLKLPPRMVITGECAGREEFCRRLESALASGCKLVQFHQPGLAADDTRYCLDDAMALCRQRGALLLVNGTPDMISRVSADGLHVDALGLMQLDHRPVTSSQLFSATCHNEAELARAESLGADFVVLAPVKVTTGHPETPVLGWGRFRQLSLQFSIPVYAQGGLTESDLADAYRAGAHGIAAHGAFW